MTDTHFHFEHCFEEDKNAGAKCLEKMAEENTFFGLDIGTRCDDLLRRTKFIEETIKLIENKETQKQIEKFIYFSAGIWPDPDSIKNRYDYMEILKKQINEFRNNPIFGNHLCAIGEGGIDHHWNVNNVDHRDENAFTEEMFEWEKELFVLQLELAKEMNLPFIIHSRDGFDETIECVDKANWHKGILHCCSYSWDKVKEFVDRGWFVSFSGSVTYTKKSKMEQMDLLLRNVPSDRILLETDSPYLAPVPLRGSVNSPLNIVHTYNFIAEKRGIWPEELQELVNENAVRLFNLN